MANISQYGYYKSVSPQSFYYMVIYANVEFPCRNQADYAIRICPCSTPTLPD